MSIPFSFEKRGRGDLQFEVKGAAGDVVGRVYPRDRKSGGKERFRERLVRRLERKRG